MKLLSLVTLALLTSCAQLPIEGHTYQKLTTYRELGTKCSPNSYYSYSEGHCIALGVSTVEGPNGIKVATQRTYQTTPDLVIGLNKPIKHKVHTKAKTIDCKVVLESINQCTI